MHTYRRSFDYLLWLQPCHVLYAHTYRGHWFKVEKYRYLLWPLVKGWKGFQKPWGLHIFPVWLGILSYWMECRKRRKRPHYFVYKLNNSPKTEQSGIKLCWEEKPGKETEQDLTGKGQVWRSLFHAPVEKSDRYRSIAEGFFSWAIKCRHFYPRAKSPWLKDQIYVWNGRS